MAADLDKQKSQVAIPWHARMWPRAVFDAPVVAGTKRPKIADKLEILQRPGVYVLYRDDIPYYIGQATKLMTRLRTHHKPGGRYSLFWNYFSVFAIDDTDERDRIEAILITVFPTFNGATPRIERGKFPADVRKLIRAMRLNEIGIRSDEDEDGTED